MEKENQEEEKKKEIRETGSLDLREEKDGHRIKLLTIIGEIEGHEAVAGNTKATKYEHLLPMLAEVEDSREIDGVLILLNTLGGDVEEMIASLSKPTVSLVLGGSHSIGGPLAVSARYSFIVPSGTMIIHPVRSSGMFIGVPQSLRNMSDHPLSGGSLPDEERADRRTDAQPHRAGERRGNSSGRRGGCAGRPDRRGGRNEPGAE